MIRLSVWVASVVWSVEKTRCPVSAALSAVSRVSRSRISPMRMTSGSWRSTWRSAEGKDSVSLPTSRCEIFDITSRCRNSIGSSIVITLTRRCWFTWLIIAASAVDLPEPVIPVTRTSPRGLSAISSSTTGRYSSRMVLTSYGNGPEGEGERAPLLVDVGPEAAHARHADGEVRLLLLGELLHLPRRHDLLGERLQVFGLERRHVETQQLAVDPHRRRTPDLEQQVRGVPLHHLTDGVLEVERGCRRDAGDGLLSHWDRPGRGPVRTPPAASPPRRPPGSRR